jgi:hypothetical protein
VLSDLQIYGMGRDGLGIAPGGSDFFNAVSGTRVEIFQCMGSGFHLHRMGSSVFIGCYAHDNGEYGFTFYEAAFSRLIGCYAENNFQLLAFGESNPNVHGNFSAFSCHACAFISCGVENFDHNGTPHDINVSAILLANCLACEVTACWFLNLDDIANGYASTGVRLVSGCKACTINGCNHSYITYSVWIETEASGAGNGSNRGNIVAYQSIQTTGTYTPGYQTIPIESSANGTTNSGYNFAFLPTSDRGGLGAILLPSVTGVNEIDGGAAYTARGTLVYDCTANALKFHNGSAWKTVAVTA